MTKVFTQADGHCRVFTFKEGLLSAVAHDLELEVSAFRVELEGDALSATFDAASLRVLHALEAGVPKASSLSAKDKATIEQNLASDVLASRRHSTVTFKGTFRIDGDRAQVDGMLTLVGKSRPIGLQAVRAGAQWKGSVVLNQPDFGITPFRAMLGTLRVKPEVRVEIVLPA